MFQIQLFFAPLWRMWPRCSSAETQVCHRSYIIAARVNHSIIVRLMPRFRQTGNVTDRPRAGRPSKTTPREDRLIFRRARQRPFSTVGALRSKLVFGGHISTRIVIRRLHHQRMRARRPIQRPQLTLRHRHARFDWSHDHMGWTIRTWRRVHWSDESRFFATSYRRSCKGLAPTKHFISGQPYFGHNCYWGWDVTVWGCFSFDCKLDLYVHDGNLTGQKYRDNVLAPRVVPHFDNHALDDNARPHRTRIVQHFFYSKRLFRQFHGLRCRQTWTL
jgi:transposase